MLRVSGGIDSYFWSNAIMSKNYVLKKGQTLFKEGSFSDSAFIIESGEIEISKTNEMGDKVVIDVLEQSEIVGEMGLIDGQPRSATATAKTEATIKEITQDQFKVLSKKNPQAMMPILKILTKRLRKILKTVVANSRRK